MKPSVRLSHFSTAPGTHWNLLGKWDLLVYFGREPSLRLVLLRRLHTGKMRSRDSKVCYLTYTEPLGEILVRPSFNPKNA